MPIIMRYQGQDYSLPVPAEKSGHLARLIGQHIALARPLCLGIGHCGQCRVLFRSPPPAPTPAELRMLSTHEREHGVRLACRHTPKDGMIVDIPDTPEALRHPNATPLVPPMPEKISCSARLAVDLGTTSLAWRAEDETGGILAEGQTLNPQMNMGSDVMTRLAESAVPGGAERLRHAVAGFLGHLVEELRNNGMHVTEIGLAANPAMTALALGKDVSGLCAAPYRLDNPGDADERLDGLPPLWIPPQLGPFAGGDVSAGLALLLDAPRPFVLADMGTNGEFVLMRDGLPPLVASVPLGPALEGVGMRCGGMAGPGAVVSYHAGPDGIRAVTWNGEAPRHIAGTGYLSLARLLLDLGFLRQDGTLEREDASAQTPSPLAFLKKKSLVALEKDSATGEWLLPLPGGLFLSAGDVENLLKVKAAFSLALEMLLRKADVPAPSLNCLYLAGALGQHAPLAALQALGFAPSALFSKIQPAGNTALQGMALLLRPGAETLRARLRSTLKECIVLNLAVDPYFQDAYIRHMHFSFPQAQ